MFSIGEKSHYAYSTKIHLQKNLRMDDLTTLLSSTITKSLISNTTAEKKFNF